MGVIHGPFQLVRADLPKCTLRINFSVKAWILPKQNQRYFSMGTALLWRPIHRPVTWSIVGGVPRGLT